MDGSDTIDVKFNPFYVRDDIIYRLKQNHGLGRPTIKRFSEPGKVPGRNPSLRKKLKQSEFLHNVGDIYNTPFEAEVYRSYYQQVIFYSEDDPLEGVNYSNYNYTDTDLYDIYVNLIGQTYTAGGSNDWQAGYNTTTIDDEFNSAAKTMGFDYVDDALDGVLVAGTAFISSYTEKEIVNDGTLRFSDFFYTAEQGTSNALNKDTQDNGSGGPSDGLSNNPDPPSDEDGDDD
jgi:hypothetical protein